MSTELATVSSYWDMAEANMAKNLLASEGIQAVLTGGEMVSMAWHLSNAVGGVKLQVLASDFTRATEILESLNDNQPYPDESETRDEDIAGYERDEHEVKYQDGAPFDNTDSVITPESEQEVKIVDDDRLTDRAFRSALFGIIFIPLQFYATFLLVQIYLCEKPLGHYQRQRVLMAVVINVPYVLLLLIVLRSLFATR